MDSKNLKVSKPLIAIVGPTASGKTALAVALAKKYGGEIICADSRTVYKGLDIGTAKPTKEEQAVVPHWGVDLVQPGELFTVADFQRYAKDKIDEIHQRGKVPFLVGGTGLYIDAVIYDFQFPPRNEKKIAKFQSKTREELIDYCIKNNVNLPNNPKNKRHLIHAILRKGVSLERGYKLEEGVIVVGISTEKRILRTRIMNRTEQIFSKDVVKETLDTALKYGWNNEALTGNVYPIIRKLVGGELTLEEAKQLFCHADWRLAKRQMTWLKRDRNILWLELSDAHTYIDQQLALLIKT